MKINKLFRKFSFEVQLQTRALLFEINHGGSAGIVTRIQIITPLFCVLTQRMVLISYRRFGTTYRSHSQSFLGGFLNPENGTDRLSRNVCSDLPPYSLNNNAEQRSSDLLRGGSLKSRLRYALNNRGHWFESQHIQASFSAVEIFILALSWPASYTMDTGVCLRRGWSGRSVKLTTVCL